MILYMVRKLAPNSSHFTRGLVKYIPGRGYFRAVSSPNGDKFVTSPPHPPIVERLREDACTSSAMGRTPCTWAYVHPTLRRTPLLHCGVPSHPSYTAAHPLLALGCDYFILSPPHILNCGLPLLPLRCDYIILFHPPTHPINTLRPTSCTAMRLFYFTPKTHPINTLRPTPL